MGGGGSGGRGRGEGGRTFTTRGLEVWRYDYCVRFPSLSPMLESGFEVSFTGFRMKQFVVLAVEGFRMKQFVVLAVEGFRMKQFVVLAVEGFRMKQFVVLAVEGFRMKQFVVLTVEGFLLVLRHQSVCLSVHLPTYPATDQPAYQTICL